MVDAILGVGKLMIMLCLPCLPIICHVFHGKSSPILGLLWYVNIDSANIQDYHLILVNMYIYIIHIYIYIQMDIKKCCHLGG